tara:strand:- start:149 stop:1213 length:1065 start_codon:yes stop_codon:yes gene_type:complete
MANMDIKSVKFFTDHINFLMSSGIVQDGNFDVISGSDLINSFNLGSEPELFDMRPMNQCQFETSENTTARTDHVLINIDLNSNAFNCDYIAILNHNMDSSQAKVRVKSSNTESHINNADMSGGTDISGVSEVVNADTVSGNVVIPGTDGSTIFTFNSSTNRYWGLQFEGKDGDSSDTGTDGSFNSTYDLKIGCILIGESYQMPHNPELSLRRTIIYDGVNIQESVGGQKFGNATHLGRRFQNVRSKSPFSTATFASGIYGGRIIYDLNFNYLASSNIMPEEYDTEDSDQDTVVSDVWNRTKGNFIPFIFSSDSTDTGNNAERSYLFARFGQNNLSMEQVALNTFNISMRIEEEF